MNNTYRNLRVAVIAGLTFSAAGALAQTPNYYPHPASLQGFPASGTSMVAEQELEHQGFMESLSREEMDAASGNSSGNSAASGKSASSGSAESDDRGSVSITPQYGTFKTSLDLNGSTYTLPMYANYKLTDRVGLSLDLPLQYTTFRSFGQSLHVWNPDLTVGLPIKVMRKTKDLPLAWTITPHAGGGGYFADDQGDSHTYIGHYGVTSMLGYETPWFTISVGDQITAYKTISRSGSYTQVDRIDQKLLKNGVKISVPLGQSWVVDAYGVDTEFLNDTGLMQRYETVGVSLGYHRATMKKGSFIKIGAYTDLGTGYRSAVVQFGTGWKF